MRTRRSPATIIALVSLFFSLSGTALAAVIISSNSQVAANTIAGHSGPASLKKNIIAGSVGTTDLHNKSVTAGKLAPSAPWREVGTVGQPQFDSTCLPDPPCHFWANYGGNYAHVAFYKDPLGVVHLKGTAICTEISGNCGAGAFQLIFTLPAGFIPAADEYFAVPGSDSYGQILVLGQAEGVSAGQVIARVGVSTAYMSLDGITFRAGA
jgi:hypothetical protein